MSYQQSSFTTADLTGWNFWEGDGDYFSISGSMLVIDGIDDGWLHAAYKAIDEISSYTYLKEPITFEAVTRELTFPADFWYYGITLLSESANYYLRIDEDWEGFKVSKVVNDTWTDMTSWKKFSDTSSSLWNDASNTLGLTYDGSQLKVVINGTIVGSVSISGLRISHFMLYQAHTGKVGFVSTQISGQGTNSLTKSMLIEDLKQTPLPMPARVEADRR